ncbi:glutathione S-transferase family protein [Xenorhabdus innexi]|uniref:Glutathione S-transferase n=1 Tax=Xenorhabdus innexi TaxID=290109 RepID=A0A1N6MZ52_9GAMM|nr:glutathione S-transferase family protein [Xenorhabdus innexi]PHM33433.1 glutathione S-transferase [Xenorhabdus innexi]SIP74092.1 Glutathione S-transferase domain protein [Xenorhabdus innexi]
MKIYTFPKSRSLRVLWALEELGVSYDTVRVDLLNDNPNVTSPHPRGKVPFMVDGNVSVEETLAICLYLCEKHPEKGLYSTDLKEKSNINSWLSFALTDLESPIWNLLKQLIFIPEEKRSSELVNYFRKESEKVISQLKLDKDFEWITGNNFTLADIFMSHILLWAKFCSISISPTINDYINRATNRASYLKAQEKNNQ